MNKYPRTLHFQFSPEIHSDDKVVHMKHLGNFISQEYIITEKMDGQNNCAKGLDSLTNEYPGIFARTHAQQTQLPWDSYIIAWYHNYKYMLNPDTWYFMENMFAEHSIIYENLDAYMFLFNMYLTETDEFASWDEVVSEAERLELKTPEVLFRGTFNSMVEVKEWMESEIKKPSLYGSEREGFVMRPASRFKREDFSKVVGKFVRFGHVQTENGQHWTRNWKQAKLLKDVK